MQLEQILNQLALPGEGPTIAVQILGRSWGIGKRECLSFVMDFNERLYHWLSRAVVHDRTGAIEEDERCQ